MQRLRAHRLYPLLTCLLTASWAVVCSAPPTLEPQIQLAERLPFAETHSLDDRVTGPAARREGDAVVQNSGTSIRFGVAVPHHGKLVASLQLDEPSGASDSVRVRVSLFDAAEQNTQPIVLLKETIVSAAETAPTRLSIDLTPWSEHLVNLDLVVMPQDRLENRTTSLRWNELRIDGARPSHPAAVTIPRARYNVLVILLDSLRADHLTPYGAPDIATPHLADLAAKGVVFEAARSNASWTRPSVVTMFSSQYPWNHGVTQPDSILVDTLPYLPELLAKAGYRSVGASGNDMVSALFGMSRGFETLFSLRKSKAYRASRDPLKRARFVWTHLVDPLTRQQSKQQPNQQPRQEQPPLRPFFVYLHQLDPHSPYEPTAKYRRQFARTPIDPAMEASVESVLHLRMRADDLTTEQIDALGRLYKGEVAFMDDYVGELMRQLEAHDLTKNTLIIFTSDHGEEFFEHASLGHGHTVYDELLRVPLIMRLDGVLPAGTRLRQRVELIDLAPTVLDLLGLEIPNTMQGRSLLPLIEDPTRTRAGVTLASSAKPTQYAIGYGRWKLIRHDPIRGTAEETVELFDLAQDPKEQRDVSPERPIVTSALRQLLGWHLERNRLSGQGPAPRAKIDSDTLEALRAIGYVGQ